MTRPGGDRTAQRNRTGRAEGLKRPVFAPPTSAPVPGLEAPTITAAEAIARKPSGGQLVLTHEYVVDGDDAEALWQLYSEAIGPLDQVAALKHLEGRDDLMAVFAHPDITKIVAWDGVEPVGLGLITNNLDAVSEASPAFFANLYPEHAERNTIYYGMAVLVKATKRGMTVYGRVYLDMWQIPAAVGGVLVFDMCKANRDAFDGDAQVAGIASAFPNSSWKVIDQQTWYAAELPEPLR